MKKLFVYTLAAIAGCIAFSSCEKSDEAFDNKSYISTSIVSTILLDGKTADTKVINTEMAQPMKEAVNVLYAVSEAKVGFYNEAYYASAEMLPADYYEFDKTTAIINAGSVKSTDVTINFKNLGNLDSDKTYVLPVVTTTSGLEVLASKSTAYYVIKGASLINVVANINENKLSLVNPDAATGLSNMSQVTMECYVRVTEFGKLISTLMGIEGYFLVRIGDAGVPDNQIQLATSNGNVTDSQWQLETGKWTHIALTFDSSNGATDVYFNGVHKGSTQYSNFRSAVNWANPSGRDPFYIGRSYADDRYFDGEMCEARVWNRVLTAEEINAKNHFYKVETNADGLVAYWKFDEGSGNRITDHTNGYDVVAANAITWLPVTLPEK